MNEKTKTFDKQDEQNLLKRKGKRKDGMVYAHVNGISGFYPITKIPIDELDGLTFSEYIKGIKKTLDNKDKQVDALKQVLSSTRIELKKLKGKVDTYVV